MALNNSFDKLIGYFSIITKKPFTYNGKLFEPPKTLYISPLFFRDYECPSGCGWCCPRFSLDYFKMDLPTLSSFYPDTARLLEEQVVTINGKEYHYQSITQKARKDNYCLFLELERDRRCMIHNANPLSCRIEPIKIYKVKNSGWVTKKCFSRGWVVRYGSCARCRFKDFDHIALSQDIKLILELGKVAEEFDIRTYAKEIAGLLLGYLEEGEVPRSKILVK